MKILIIALAGIGDALMFTPAIELLRKELPSAQIDALVMFKGTKEIYETNRNLSQVIHFDFIKEGFISSLKFVLGLRKKYDVSINVYPSNRKEYNIINFLVGAKKRVGVKYLHMNFQNFGWLNNVKIKEDNKTHNVKTNIKLIEKLLNKQFNNEPEMQIELSEEDFKYADNYLNQINVYKNDFVVGLHPGCATLKNHIKRRWEPEKFSQLGKKLIAEKKAKILLFGGPEEDELKQLIKSSINDENCYVIESEKFLQSIAIMKRCDVIVTNDSALMHVASALGLKVVAIIGPTNQYFIHPWKTDHKIVSLNLGCSPCFYYSPKPLICSRSDIQFKCIKELDVERVYSAVNSFEN